MNLPSKDKNGFNYLSYSQISLFKRDKQAYYESYVLKNKFKGNEYTDFGIKVGSALEKNDFSLFNDSEIKTLLKVKRLDLFEQKTILKYENFYVIGYLDSATQDFKHIIDYKTGGVGKHIQYKKDDYNQLQIYVLSLRQKGLYVDKASVEFITRKGNLYKGEPFCVSETPPISLDVDISYKKLKKTYWELLKTAEEISCFYERFK